MTQSDVRVLAEAAFVLLAFFVMAQTEQFRELGLAGEQNHG
jgi:hypothetical protein